MSSVVFISVFVQFNDGTVISIRIEFNKKSNCRELGDDKTLECALKGVCAFSIKLNLCNY